MRATLHYRNVLLVAAALIAACSTVLDIGDEPPIDVAQPDGGVGADAEAGPGSDAVAADAALDADAAPDASEAGPFAKVVWVSTGVTQGDMRFGNVLNDAGRAEADQRCSSEGKAAGLNGTFVAWLSTDVSDAIGRLPPNTSWSLPNGTLIFVSRATIPDGGALMPIDRDALGKHIDELADRSVWTGTDSDGGRLVGNTCMSWTTNGGGGVQARVGSIDSGARWTEDYDTNCDVSRHVYCFQQ